LTRSWDAVATSLLDALVPLKPLPPESTSRPTPAQAG
jgi:hypothetical protein